MDINKNVGFALDDDALDNVTGGASKDYGNSKYHIGQYVRVRDKKVKGGEWTGKIWELPNYTTINGKTTWFYNVYIKEPPSPYECVPTIIENIPQSSIIGLA